MIAAFGGDSLDAIEIVEKLCLKSYAQSVKDFAFPWPLPRIARYPTDW